MEGKNFTLEWNYILNDTISSAQYVIVKGHGSDSLIGWRFGPGYVTVQGGFQARFRANVTVTRTQLTILAVQRSDEGSYKLTILPTGAGSISELVTLVVNCKYWLKYVPLRCQSLKLLPLLHSRTSLLQQWGQCVVFIFVVCLVENWLQLQFCHAHAHRDLTNYLSRSDPFW